MVGSGWIYLSNKMNRDGYPTSSDGCALVRQDAKTEHMSKHMSEHMSEHVSEQRADLMARMHDKTNVRTPLRRNVGPCVATLARFDARAHVRSICHRTHHSRIKSEHM